MKVHSLTHCAFHKSIKKYDLKILLNGSNLYVNFICVKLFKVCFFQFLELILEHNVQGDRRRKNFEVDF